MDELSFDATILAQSSAKQTYIQAHLTSSQIEPPVMLAAVASTTTLWDAMTRNIMALCANLNVQVAAESLYKQIMRQYFKQVKADYSG